MVAFSNQEDEKEYYEHRASEEEFLDWYRRQEKPNYEKPSLTVDMVLMCYSKVQDKLKILLIKRKGHPFKNSWALPVLMASALARAGLLRKTKLLLLLF